MECESQPRPPPLRALGRHEPPSTIEIAGHGFRRVEVLKHDSWAASAVYRDGDQWVICKFNRQQAICGLPMRWLGRRLAARERRFLERLAGITGIPRLLGPVTVRGRLQRHAVAREFVPGHALAAGQWVDDSFFPRLWTILTQVHDRGVAHVDLHKRENILVGDDGQPYLIDYQISFAAPRGSWARVGPWRWLLRLLQRSDDYHLIKHHAKHRPDQCQFGEHEIAELRPWWIRLHRCVAVPFRTLRRKLLVRLGVRTGSGKAESELRPEVAFRPAHLPARGLPALQ